MYVGLGGAASVPVRRTVQRQAHAHITLWRWLGLVLQGDVIEQGHTMLSAADTDSLGLLNLNRLG